MPNRPTESEQAAFDLSDSYSLPVHLYLSIFATRISQGPIAVQTHDVFALVYTPRGLKVRCLPVVSRSCLYWDVNPSCSRFLRV